MRVLFFLLFTASIFGQQLRFTGSEISVGTGMIFSGNFVEAQAGDTLYFGQLVYYDIDDGKFYLASVDSSNHFETILAVVAEDTTYPDIVSRFLIKGFIKDTSGDWTAGSILYTESSDEGYGDAVLIDEDKVYSTAGYALDTTTIFVDPNKEGYYWDDLRFPASVLRLPGSSPPTATDYVGSQVLAFPTNADATIHFLVQMPHSWIEGTDITPHIHYALSADGTDPDSVRWVFTYSWADIDEAIEEPTSANVTDIVTSLVDSTHYLLDLGTLDGDGKTISSILLCSLTRDISEDDYGGSIYLLEIDIHYLTDGKGSRQELVK